MQYVVTNDIGEYSLPLNKNTSYAISVGSMGYKTFDFTYDAQGDLEKNIELIEDIIQLQEVVVELPIYTRKDTITYKTDKFMTGEERKLKDVLKKLPGIEVDEDGTVTSNGKKVTHLLVENKSFFGGNSKLGVENIPANSIDQIDVIDDYNEISFLKGMTKTNNLALNVKLKKNKNNFVFGGIEAGKGNKSFYKAHANLFYYHPKFNINSIGGLNNVGKKTFTRKDYGNFIGGPSSTFDFRDFYREKSTISSDIEPTDVLKSETKLGAVNFTRTINENIDVSSYFIFSQINNETRKEAINQYQLPGFSYFENLTNNWGGHKNLGIGKLKLKYAPNSLEQWSFDILAKRKNNAEERSIVSIIDTNEQSFEILKDSDEDYVNGNLEWHKKISTGHAFSTSSNIEYNTNGSDAFWNTNRPISDGLIPLDSADVYRVKLLRQVRKKSISGIFKHYWIINNFNLLHTTLGNQYREHKFFTADSQLLDDETVNDFSSNGFGNNLNFKLNDLYLGLYYNVSIGKFDIHQSLFVHNYSWSIDQSGFIKKNKLVLLPDLSIRIGSKSSRGFLRFDSSLKSAFSDVSKLTRNFYLRSYNSVFVGNEHLENELSHSSTLNYIKSSLYRGLYVLGTLNYTYKINPITNSIIENIGGRVVSPVVLNAPNQSLKASLILKKNSENINFYLRANLLSTKSSELVNSTIAEYSNTNGYYKASVQTAYDGFPIIEVGFKQSLGSYRSNNRTSKFTTNEPYFKFDYNFLKGFVFSFDYTHHKYQNKPANLTNSYNLSNVSLSYGKETSAWNFKIASRNLFDVKFINQNSFSTYIISDRRTFILPRIIMVSLSYDL